MHGDTDEKGRYRNGVDIMLNNEMTEEEIENIRAKEEEQIKAFVLTEEELNELKRQGRI